ncbi:hypothetical protein BH23GEM9_BH23GEM9_06380 [soil metagenome]
MINRVGTLVVALAVWGAVWVGMPVPLEAQTRADSAAVLLHAAEQLRLRGETSASRALLQYLERQYAGTVAAAEAELQRVALRGVRDERSGRTELMVGGTTYGAWLGLAVPLMMDADDPEAYGVGFLAGAPLGFLAGRWYALRTQITEGQARAITFGGTWGTYQGFGWAEALKIGDRRYSIYCEPDFSGPCLEDTEAHMPSRVAASVVGGLAGIGAGAYLARKPINIGTAAAVSSSGLWASWFGFGLGFLADLEDEALLTTTLLAGNAALLGAAAVAPRWDVTESRVRLVSMGGLIGGLTGVGLLLLIQPDDEKVAISFPLVMSAAGLAAGVHWTRDRDTPAEAGDGRGALLNLEGGRWTLDTPAAALRMQRADRNRAEPVAWVPLLRARF